MLPGFAVVKMICDEPLDRNSMNALAPSRSSPSVGAFLAIMNPSIGASRAFSASYWVPKFGYGKKSRSARSSLAATNCSDTNMPSRYMPAFFWTRAWAASCHVRPVAPSW